MPILLPHQVAATMDRLSEGLSVDNSGRLKAIIELLDQSGRSTVVGAQAALYPAVSASSANKALDRLIKAINTVARTRGLDILLTVDADKKLGGNRQLWFEGEQPLPAARREALDTVTSAEMIPDTRGGMVLGAATVAILTFNEHEFDALRACFKLEGPVEKLNEADSILGKVGELTVLHVHSLAGQGQVNASILTGNIIHNYRPTLVLGVGIAMGLKEGQNIGDVLVSTEVRDTEMLRINADGSVTHRGRTFAVEAYVEKICNARRSAEAAQPGGLKVQSGRIICGNPLSDNEQNRDALVAFDPEAIGYEMESYGLAAAARDLGVHWLLVKAIADWGDGKKGQNKENRQKFAARNAAEFARKLLDHWRSPVAGGGPPPGGVKTPVVPGYRTRAIVDEIEYQCDVRGAEASLKIGDSPKARVEGVLVMEALLRWAEDDKAPSLFALLGEYGMGKSVTCERFYEELRAKRQNDNSRRESMLFNLKDLTLTNGVPTLAETIDECAARGWPDARRGDVTLDFVWEKMRTGAVIIFDGLDEVLVKLTAAQGQNFTNSLLQLAADYRARNREGAPPRLLIACRTQYFRSLDAQRTHFLSQHRSGTHAQDYRALELLPFTPDQVESYLLRTLPSEDTRGLMDLIRSVHNLEELSQRPYTLKLIRDFIPEIEAERATGRDINGVTLYRKMVNGWLARDSGKHHIRPEDKQSLAAHLAAHLWHSGTSAIPVADLENWLHLWLRDRPALTARYDRLSADQLEEDLRTATFLARQDNNDPSTGQFRFAHTSLHEYFLAEYLLMAARENRPEGWSMKPPSAETLDFLGQMLSIEPDKKALSTIESWRVAPRPEINKLILAFALRARKRDWPTPSLRAIDFSECDFNQQIFSDLDLSEARFCKARLANAQFIQTRLEHADFTGARSPKAVFDRCAGTHARFNNCDLSGATFHRCDLTGAAALGAIGYRARVLLCPGAESFLTNLPASLRDSTLDPKDAATRAHLEWLIGHAFAVTACAFSPDGARVLSASMDQTLRLWNARTGECMLTFEGHQDSVRSCAFSPDGARVLSASTDRTLRLWDVRTGQCMLTFEGHQGSVVSCAFSPDGARVLSASMDNTLRLWDARTGECMLTFEGHQGSVVSCAFSPDGARVLSAGDDQTLRLWNARTGECMLTFEGHQGSVRSCVFSPDGARVLSASMDNTLRLWDARTGECMLTFEGHQDYVVSCAFSPDGARVLSASTDRTLRLWDVRTGQCMLTFEGSVHSCAFSPDGARVLSASMDNTLRLWDARTGECMLTFERHRGFVECCAFSPDGSRVLSAGDYQPPRLWDARTGECMLTFEGHQGSVHSCAFSPDGARVLSAGDDQALRLWDACTGECMRIFEGHQGSVRSCAFSPDGARVLSASTDRTLRLWDVRTGQCMLTFEGHEDSVRSCAFSPDGARVLSADDYQTLRLWNARTGECMLTFEGHQDSVVSCAFSPDGARVLSAGDDQTLRLWNARTGECMLTFEGHQDSVQSCAFSSDGARVLSTSRDATLRMWDPRTGECILTFRGHSDWIRACAFSPDGARVLSAGDDGTLRLWDAHTGEQMRIHAFSDNGWAAWIPRENRLLAAAGDAWRYLHWRLHGVEGIDALLPLEAVGDVCRP